MITGVHISSSEMVIQKDGNKKSPPPQFSKNQIVSAKVLAQLADGRVQLSVNGRTVTAKTGLLLNPGEAVKLQVMQEKEAVILKLIGPGQRVTANHVSALLGSLTRNESIFDLSGQRLGPIKQLMADISLKSGKADDQFLPRLLEKGGLLLENKLSQLVQSGQSPTDIRIKINQIIGQDMKAALLNELTNMISGKAGAPPSAMTLSESIEGFQVLNQSSAESGRFILPFPIFNDAAFKFGQLLIDTGGQREDVKKGDDDRVTHISFLLDMSRLGPMRADFSIYKQDISGRFLFKDSETCRYMESLIPQLKDQLGEREFMLRQINCEVAQKEEIQHSALIETVLKQVDNRMLNIVV